MTKASYTLSVLLAVQSHVAVIFRRGPTRWVRAIRWNTLNDSFVNGDWFHGRLYLDRCDISPDGRWMIYMTAYAHLSRSGNFYRTAISQVPSFKPFVSNDRGILDGGGGYFIDNTRAMMGGVVDLPTLGELQPSHSWANVELSRGWHNNPPSATYRHGKLSPDGEWVLHRKATERVDRGRMILVRKADGFEDEIHGASWADWDQSDRLVFARAGQLMRRHVEGGVWKDRVIANFDDGRVPPEIPFSPA